YSRVAFEADLPRIEAADFGGNCNRFTGTGCVNPPPGSNFYPIYSIAKNKGFVNDTSGKGPKVTCVWQLGGNKIKDTTDTFGGNSAAEFGPLLFSFYPNANPAIRNRTNNFRNILDTNPCPAYLCCLHACETSDRVRASGEPCGRPSPSSRRRPRCVIEFARRGGCVSRSSRVVGSCR